MMRRVTLSWRINRAAKVKSLLLVVLVAVSMTVFLIVTELSRVSSEDLDQAITAESGETGTYIVELSTGFGLSPAQLAEQVDTAVAPYVSKPSMMIDVLPAITPECPPYAQLGSQEVLILRDNHAVPAALPFGHELPVETEICFDGQSIPGSAVYLPTQAEQAKWGGIGVYVDSDYEQLVLLDTTAPVRYRFVVVTGAQADQRDTIERSVRAHLQPVGQQFGVDADRAVSVTRADSGAGIRSASEGIKLVYAIIGWGVLVLGGLGLLISELIVVRDRMWFIGLARAVGARTRHIAALIVTDVLSVLTAGTALSLVLVAVLQPVAATFARQAFHVDVQLLQASTFRQLILGGLVVLVLAAGYPTLHAIRQDPLDVLEPKSS